MSDLQIVHEAINRLVRNVELNQSSRPFYGALLRQMAIRLSDICPTAGVRYNSITKKLELKINYNFFSTLSDEERIAVLIHEIEHIVRGHIFLVNDTKLKDARKRNIAMDKEINQYITGLPSFALYPTKKEEKFREWQYYYDNIVENKDKDKTGEADKTGEGTEDNENSLDDHSEWGEASKEEMLKAAHNLIERTIQKESFDYNTLPKSVKDLLDYIKNESNGLNFYKLLNKAVKRSVVNSKELGSWARTSRRYGVYSQGVTHDYNPKVEVLFDTSGSISKDEMEKYLGIIYKLVKTLNAEVVVNFFHTSRYYHQKYKKNTKIDWDKIESGGTDLKDSLMYIENKKPELTFILTDGYYSDVETNNKKMNNCIFIISKDGNMDHPFRDRKWASTIKVVD